MVHRSRCALIIRYYPQHGRGGLHGSVNKLIRSAISPCHTAPIEPKRRFKFVFRRTFFAEIRGLIV
jgi:hypothetical protein